MPEVAEFTRTGAPGDSLVLSMSAISIFAGNDFGKDVRFLTYGQNMTGGDLLKADIFRLNSIGAAINLNTGLPAWSMYLIWPGNDHGYGKPIAINRTDAWWVGPNDATRGDTVSVFGRNLSHGNGTSQSWIYLQSSSGSGQWVTPTSVNPYKVDFVVPASLANDTYQVWVHNGHGGALGWSGPLTLTLDNGPLRNGTTINVVTQLGINNTGKVDDTAAINNAFLTYRFTGTTLYFPTGTYLVNGQFTCPPRQMVLLGDGKGLTTILAVPPASGPQPQYIFQNQMDDAEIKNMTIDARAYPANSMGLGVIWATSSVDLRLTGLEVLTSGNPVGSFHLNNLLHLKNCDFHGTQAAYLGNSTQVFIDGCNFYGMYDSTTMVYSFGSKGVCVTNSTGNNEDSSDPSSGYGWSSGRFYTGSGIWGTEENIYIGHDQTINLTPRPLAGNQNAGEQLLWETTGFNGVANPSAIGSNTVSFSSLVGSASNEIGLSVAVISGTGLGQTRLVTGFNPTTGTLTLDSPWNVVPDTNSRIIWLGFFQRIVAYDNNLGFNLRAATTWPNSIASSGFEAFAGGSDIIADSNVITNPHYAISLWAGQNNTPAPLFFPLVTNNSAKGALIGARDLAFDSEGRRQFGKIYRHNSFDGTGLANSQGTQLDGGSASAPAFSLCLWERNTFSNVWQGIVQRDDPGPSEDEVYFQNQLSLGTAPSSGSQACYFGPEVSLALRNNTATGFATTFAGSWSTPKNPLELPHRTSDLGDGLGSTDTLSVWDAGITPLPWTATPGQSWLSLSSTSGTVADQTGSSSVGVTVNGAGLTSGTNTADITFTSGSQTRKVEVNFTATFFDGFENGFGKWTVSGKPPLSSNSHVHSGSNSCLLAAPGTTLTHNMSGTFSRKVDLWFYDDTSITHANVAASVEPVGTTRSLLVNTAVSGTHYCVQSGSTCVATAVPRTTGWHKFTFDYSSGNTAYLSIDNTLVQTMAAASFSKIVLQETTQTSKAFFDDVLVY